MARKCKICGLCEATIPDREAGGKRKTICGKCHAERLKNDLRHILYLEKKRKEDGGGVFEREK